jgi:NhaP-type Na+/H+ or K+/H+ antiporter
MLFLRSLFEMVENIVRKTTKKTWYKWSLYVNIILFFIVAIMLYFVVIQSYDAGRAYVINEGNNADEMWSLMYYIAILVIAIVLLFFQFFKNLFTIMRRLL